MVRVAVAGGSGLVGSAVVEELRRRGHEAIPLSRSVGVDVLDGTGLAEALTGVDTVVDVLNTGELDPAKAVGFFETTTRRLLDAEAAVGVGHHVVLSIVQVDAVEGNGHYAGKRAQEAATVAGPVPWTIRRATQFHDFAGMVAGWTTRDGTAWIAPLLVQPVAVQDVASALVDDVEAGPRGRSRDLAGPETEDFVDMARRTLAARGSDTRVRASWRIGPFGTDMAGEVLLPADDAELGGISFDAWLGALGAGAARPRPVEG